MLPYSQKVTLLKIITQKHTYFCEAANALCQQLFFRTLRHQVYHSKEVFLASGEARSRIISESNKWLSGLCLESEGQSFAHQRIISETFHPTDLGGGMYLEWNSLIVSTNAWIAAIYHTQ